MNIKATINRTLAKLGYERWPVPESYKDQRRILRGRARVIFDGGANCGESALQYAAVFPEASIYSFEPGENVMAELRRAVADKANITVQPLGLAESSGQRSFQLCSNSLINSLLPISADLESLMGGQKVQHVRTATIETVTVDDFCRQNGIEFVDVLKLDIQGAEVLALQGAERMLASRAIKLVYTEANFKRNQYEGQASFDDVWRFMREAGYILFGIYNLTRGTDMLLGYGDAIFVAPDVSASITYESFHRF